MSAQAAFGGLLKLKVPELPPDHDTKGGAIRVAALQDAALEDEARLREEGTLYSIRCDVCGTRLPFPGVPVMVAYRRCFVCGRELCPPSDYRELFEDMPERDWITVVYARYGSVGDRKEKGYIDVAEPLRAKVVSTGGRLLEIGLNEGLGKLLGDPAKGTTKKLKLCVRVFDREYKSEHEELHGIMRWPVRIAGDEYRRGTSKGDESAIKVLVAVIGEPLRPSAAVIITELLQARINDTGGRILSLDSVENLGKLFPDPCPGQPKVFICRYQLYNRRGELRLLVTPGSGTDFYLERPIYVESRAEKPYLVIHSAKFGHPIEPTRAYDVTEVVQARVDEAGGEWLNLPAEEDIHEWLGDPYVGSSKHLSIHYEIVSKVGALAAREQHGHLVEPIHILAPVVAPLLHIDQATIRLDGPIGFDPVVLDITAALRREVDEQGGQELSLRVDEDLIPVMDLARRMPVWYIPSDTFDMDDNTTDYGAIAAGRGDAGPGVGLEDSVSGAGTGTVATSAGGSVGGSPATKGKKKDKRTSKGSKRRRRAERAAAAAKAAAEGKAASGAGAELGGSGKTAEDDDDAHSGTGDDGGASESKGGGSSRHSVPSAGADGKDGDFDGDAVSLDGSVEAVDDDGHNSEDDEGKDKVVDLSMSLRHMRVAGAGIGKHSGPSFRGGSDAGSGSGGTSAVTSETGSSLDSPVMRALAKTLKNSELMKPDTVDTSMLSSFNKDQSVVSLGRGRTFRKRADGSWMEDSSADAAAGTEAEMAAMARRNAKAAKAGGYTKPQNHMINIRYIERGRARYHNVMAYQDGDHIYLRERVDLAAARPFPHIVITGAAYGHPTDGGQRIDMKERLQERVRWHRYGSRLDIGIDEPLDKTFGDPCPGVFKVLVLRYVTYTYKGEFHLDVPGPGTPLGSNVRLGWMPDQ